MKVGIIQLSDIHISSKDDFVITHRELLTKSCKARLNGCTKVIFVITGDIVKYGKQEEYDIAYDFLKACEEDISKEATYINTFNYILVPGNHDCVFDNNPIRDILIPSLHDKETEEWASEIIDQIIKPQENFWSFYSKLNGATIKPSISYEIPVQLLLNRSLIFHCYNSSALSSIEEKPGSLIIPESTFLQEPNNPSDIVISLFHHNTSWLSPNTTRNNKKMFEEHISRSSNIIMYGHEHQQKQQIGCALDHTNEVLYLESAALQQESESAYNVIILDTNDNSLVNYTYEYDKKTNMYEEFDPVQNVLQEKIKGISISKTYQETLLKIDLPIKHPNKSNLILSDIYTHPDLEPLLDIDETEGNFLNTENLLNDIESGNIVFIEGQPQAGKTALLRMLYLNTYNQGLFPIMIQGRDITNINTEDILKRNYKNQYNSKLFSFQAYLQLEKNRHILLIDNFDKSILNSEGKTKILNKFLENFDKVIVTNIDQTDVKSLLISSNKDSNIKRYRLLPLGYYKRNQLIERWITLGSDPYTSNKLQMANDVKLTYDQITNLLGEQLIPPYPVYILTLLQSLNHALKSFDITQTSYAYCYHSLIIVSLSRAEVASDDISGILNFLTELSYFLYTENKKTITTKEIDDFYVSYCAKFSISYSAEQLRTVLCKANILHEQELEIYEFSYKYIYYYLVANKLSTLIHDQQGKCIIQSLCDNLHKEKEANILIFLVHRTNDNTLIEDLLIASMLPFEHYEPITLNPQDQLFNSLVEFVKTIQRNILVSDIDPQKERENELKKTDEIQRSQQRRSNQQENSELLDTNLNDDPNIKDLNHTFRVTKILGQIVKNQREIFEKEKLISLLTEAYNVCFRSINFFDTMLHNGQDEIVEYIIDKKKGSYVKESEIKEHVNHVLTMMLYQVCLTTFSNLSFAVGTAKLNDVYDEVANRMNTPAAKLISFTIKTYYSSMRISELEDLVKDFENNPVALHILKARVRRYVYENLLPYTEKQKIGAICGLRLINRLEKKNPKNN